MSRSTPDGGDVVDDVRQYLDEHGVAPGEASLPRLAGALGMSPAAIADALEALGAEPDVETDADTVEPAHSDSVDGRNAPDGDGGDDHAETGVDREAAVDALRDVLAFYHRRLDEPIDDHTDSGDHPDRPTTARDYFQTVRGWRRDTVDELRLGWAPGDHVDELVAFLYDRGHSRAAMLATGAIGEGDDGSLYSTWSGRYVLPYFDADGEPAYAIARATGGDGGGGRGYGGHPADYQAGKYAKLRHTDDRVPFDEPIYGLDTLDDAEHVAVAEGIADAISAREAGFAVLSPVAKEFKQEHYPPLVDALEAHDIRRVTVVGDADLRWAGPDDSDEPLDSIGEAVSRALVETPAGLAGALRTADGLAERAADRELDVRVGVVTPPSLGDVPNDLDGWLTEWNGSVDVLVRAARPPQAFDAFGDAVDTGGDPADAFADFDLDEYEPSTTAAEETTDDIRDLFAAIDRLDAQRVAERSIVTEWLDGRGDKRTFAPTWAPAGYSGTAVYCDRDKFVDTGDRGGYGGPVAMAAIDAGLVRDTRCPDDVEGQTWFAAVDHLRELGFDIPRLARQPGDDDSDALDAAVTFDVREAWDAAVSLAPDDLDDAPLETHPSADTWACPRCGDPLDDAVRALAVDTGALEACDDSLGAAEYTDAYRRLRDDHGAPLPRYVTRDTRADEWATVTGALEALRFDHIDRAALASDVTVDGDDTDDGVRCRLDPAYRDSDSGESVVVYDDTGAVVDYHPSHDGRLPVHVFVALDSGALSWAEWLNHGYDALTGEAFGHVYEICRLYGAPLPEWYGMDPDHAVVLPDGDDLAHADAVDTDARLEGARDETAALYRDAAGREGGVTIHTALPSLGKTRAAIKQAQERPTFYTAGRRDLMAQALERAVKFGVRARALPVLSERAPPETVVDTGVRVVRERGQELLADPGALLAAIRERADDVPELDPDAADETDDDTPDLERDSCPTADGDHGVEWWVAVHVARALSNTPKQMHTRPHALFGDRLPCQHGSDDCPYSDGWDDVTDPEAPYDLLVGHYTPAHVEGARTYYTKTDDGRVETCPRTLVFDEFVGDAFTVDFGDDFGDIARWVAQAVAPDVDSCADLYRQADRLWADDRIRAWLEGDHDAPAMVPHRSTARLLDAVADVVDVVTTADRLRRDYRTLAEGQGAGPLRELAGMSPTWDADAAQAHAAAVRDAVARRDDLPAPVVDELEEITDTSRPAYSELEGERHLGDAVVERAAGAHIGGPLADLLERVAEALDDPDRRALRLVEDTREAVMGGRDGVERLALRSRDGYAHRHAATLLYGVLAPTDADDAPAPATLLETDSLAWDDADGTLAKHVEYGRATVLVDQEHNGATVLAPPAFAAGDGECPVVGLDATARPELWKHALGVEAVDVVDPHPTDAERRAFLHDVVGQRVIQTTTDAKAYAGDPTGKSFDGDVALVADAAEEYADAVGDPTVITTKKVERVVGDRLREAGAADVDHYSALRGRDDLGEREHAVILGYQHHGDAAVERWAALAGEETTRSGHGMALDYGSDVANAALRHMREDSVMQAALRIGREPDASPLVVAHTGALRDDMPVVGEGAVVDTYADSVSAVADAAAELAPRRFDAGDVRQRLERRRDDAPSARTVRRALARLADAGYLEREETGEGRANEYAHVDTPGAGETDLPGVEREARNPDTRRITKSYTWSVRVSPGTPRPGQTSRGGTTALPALERGADPLIAPIGGPPD